MLAETLELKGIPPSQIPGRPKRWRNKCMEILDTSITHKYTHTHTHTHTHTTLYTVYLIGVACTTLESLIPLHFIALPGSVIVFALIMQLLISLHQQRFERLDTTSEQRMENKDWLNEHLTEVARTCYQDLHAITTAGVKCFPPSFDIVPFFVRRYHRGLVEMVSG